MRKTETHILSAAMHALAGEMVSEDGVASAGSTGVLTLESISMDFLRWLRRSEEDGFPTNWTPNQLARVKGLLNDMAAAHRAASVELMQKGEAV